MKSSTAILVFSRSANGEKAGKKILCSSKKNKKAISSLIDNAIGLAAHSGLAWYRSDELSQTGNSFGAKFTKAILDVFAKGYTRVVAIGNDCPGLSQQQLQKAIDELESHDWVLGPTPKGGVYLVGVTATSFSVSEFESISWQTNMVFQQLTDNLKVSGGSYSCFPMLDDINNGADIITASKKTVSNNCLIRFLINLLTACLFEYRLTPSQLIYMYQLPANSRRGPPSNNLRLLF